MWKFRGFLKSQFSLLFAFLASSVWENGWYLCDEFCTTPSEDFLLWHSRNRKQQRKYFGWNSTKFDNNRNSFYGLINGMPPRFALWINVKMFFCIIETHSLHKTCLNHAERIQQLNKKFAFAESFWFSQTLDAKIAMRNKICANINANVWSFKPLLETW